MSYKFCMALFGIRILVALILCNTFLIAFLQSVYAQEPTSTINIVTHHSLYGGGRIYAPIRIDNYKGFMRLDTGASTSRFHKSAWNKKFIITNTAHSISATAVVAKCEEVVVPNLSIIAQSGNAIGRVNYFATRCPISSGDDLLGIDFLKGSEFTIDLKANQLRFFEPIPREGKTHLLRALGRDKDLIGIEIDIGELSTYGLLDTGAEITAVDSVYFNAHPELFESVKSRISMRGVNGKTITSRLCKIKSIFLGEGFFIKNLYAIVYDFGALRYEIGDNIPFILGYNFFDKYKWHFNFKKNITPTWNVYNY